MELFDKSIMLNFGPLWHPLNSPAKMVRMLDKEFLMQFP